MKMRKDKDFISFFDEATGHYVRSGIIKNGIELAEDPFMTSFPELLDVGIMGHCRHGQSGLCLKAGVECYQDGLHATAPNMTLEDFQEIVRQCKGNTYQIALGGCGDPDQHEHFVEILEVCQKAGIVPNFTTSGLGLTSELAMLCKKYCGAVAVSWYRSSYTLRAIDLLLRAGVKTNIHYVISNSTIEEAITRLKECSFPTGINAIVFLLHKPVGLGSQAQVLKCNDPRVKEFLELACGGDHGYKIGFDSCTVPGLVSQSTGVDLDSVDTCEGARWSAYIASDMVMLPCSFDNQARRWAVDLRSHTIREAWNSSIFEDFREHFRRNCPNCEHRLACMGGRPICPEIVLCSRAKQVGTKME